MVRLVESAHQIFPFGQFIKVSTIIRAFLFHTNIECCLCLQTHSSKMFLHLKKIFSCLLSFSNIDQLTFVRLWSERFTDDLMCCFRTSSCGELLKQLLHMQTYVCCTLRKCCARPLKCRFSPDCFPIDNLIKSLNHVHMTIWHLLKRSFFSITFNMMKDTCKHSFIYRTTRQLRRMWAE